MRSGLRSFRLNGPAGRPNDRRRADGGGRFRHSRIDAAVGDKDAVRLVQLVAEVVARCGSVRAGRVLRGGVRLRGDRLQRGHMTENGAQERARHHPFRHFVLHLGAVSSMSVSDRPDNARLRMLFPGASAIMWNRLCDERDEAAFLPRQSARLTGIPAT